MLIMSDHIKTRIHARYMIGCDGAHSWVRRKLGLKLEGDKMNEEWGVIDAIPITNFREFASFFHLAHMS